MELPPRGHQKANTTASFKYKLNRDVNRPPKYYNEGNRLAQIFLSRLRTNCSALNQHLHSKNIVPSPLCVCGSIEDTDHFLLRCPLYHNHRQEMLISVSRLCQPTVNVLLYGDDNLSGAFNDNKQIFDAVHDFLIKTKIFQHNS